MVGFHSRDARGSPRRLSCLRTGPSPQDRDRRSTARGDPLRDAKTSRVEPSTPRGRPGPHRRGRPERFRWEPMAKALGLMHAMGWDYRQAEGTLWVASDLRRLSLSF